MISLTIDCEQWNCPLLEGKKVKENNDTSLSRIGNKALLALLKKYKVKATFFVTGYFAEKEPEQILEIKQAGHEIACHGYNHFYRGNKDFDLEKDIEKSKKIIERIIKEKVIGFRAPQLQYSEKLIQILDKLGFKYDSSLHPTYLPGCYNNLKSPLAIHKPLDNKTILEIPVTVSPLRLPISWMFIRLLGIKRTIFSCRRALKVGLAPVIYVHSWEFTQVKSKYVPFYYKFKTGKSTLKKIEKLINAFKEEEFLTLKEIIARS